MWERRRAMASTVARMLQEIEQASTEGDDQTLVSFSRADIRAGPKFDALTLVVLGRLQAAGHEILFVRGTEGGNTITVGICPADEPKSLRSRPLKRFGLTRRAG